MNGHNRFGGADRGVWRRVLDNSGASRHCGTFNFGLRTRSAVVVRSQILRGRGGEVLGLCGLEQRQMQSAGQNVKSPLRIEPGLWVSYMLLCKC